MIILEILFACIAVGVVANLWAKSHVATNLKNIELYPGMYGNVGEVETLYIGTMVMFSQMDLMRRFIMRKPDITWPMWFAFVSKELNIQSGSIPPLHFKPLKHFELTELFKKFREENF